MSDAAVTSIDNLERLWRSVLDLCAPLTPEEWATPTGCPGWTVQDNVAHLIDYESGALGRPRPDHEPADVSHTKNPMGVSNEVGVDYRRSHSGAEVLEELREVSAARLAQLRGLDAEAFAAEVLTPAGPGTVADMLRLRVMDTWSHEQDIRRALDRPGDVEGPAAAEAVAFLARVLPRAIGKGAGAPDGTTVALTVGDLFHATYGVADGRASVVDDVAQPTVSLTIPATTFAALTGGRSDAPDNADVAGDITLGRAILAALPFMP